MPRRNQRQTVAERTNQILNEQQEQRRTRRQPAAQTCRQRSEGQPAEGQPPVETESAPQANVTQSTRPRVHADLVTVTFRGPLATKLRNLAEQSGMSLAKLLQDAALVYEQKMIEGYQAGTLLSQWKAEQTRG